jgi:drug/metabolite transporter (DMT)-like permease
VMTGLMGIPVLGEWPTAIDWVAIALISIGVYAVSGGPLPRRIGIAVDSIEATVARRTR